MFLSFVLFFFWFRCCCHLFNSFTLHTFEDIARELRTIRLAHSMVTKQIRLNDNFFIVTLSHANTRTHIDFGMDSLPFVEDVRRKRPPSSGCVPNMKASARGDFAHDDRPSITISAGCVSSSLLFAAACYCLFTSLLPGNLISFVYAIALRARPFTIPCSRTLTPNIYLAVVQCLCLLLRAAAALPPHHRIIVTLTLRVFFLFFNGFSFNFISSSSFQSLCLCIFEPFRFIYSQVHTHTHGERERLRYCAQFIRSCVWHKPVV